MFARVKSIVTILLTVLVAAAVVSCKGGDDKKVDNIIVNKVVQKPKSGPQRMESKDIDDTIRWVDDNLYRYKISRHSSDSLAIVENAGQKYYDNKVSLTILRPDGSVFFNKTFTKKNFSSNIPEKYNAHGVLLGINLSKAEGGQLQFIVGVGSPDESLEDFYHVMLVVDTKGATSVAAFREPTREEEE